MINFIQEGFGIVTIPPPTDNNLIQFFYVSLAPLVEEFGFRLILIGIPIFFIYSQKSSLKYFITCLWNPNTLDIHDSKKAIFLIVFVVLIVDQLLKFAVVSSQPHFTIIPKVLSITYLTNTGIFFGLFKGYNIVLILIRLAVAAFILYYIPKLKDKLEFYAVALILAGTLGNLIDRLVRGEVVDFITLSIIPTFNIADAALTIGAVLIITAYIKEKFSK